MSISLAAVAGVLAALLEISVVPGLTDLVQPHLVFIITVVSTSVIGVEEGLVIAFLGGLMTDLLLPGHQLGGSSLVLLTMAAAAAILGRALPQRHVRSAVLLVLVLALVVAPLQILVLAATAGTPAAIEPLGVLATAIVDTIVAVPVAAVLRLVWLRYGVPDRMEW